MSIHRSRLAPLILGLTLLAALASQTTVAADKPNFLVILADDMGFSDLGCYGGQIETPRLDELAAGGLRFTQFYNTARCWPTRGAIMTGFYAQQIRRDALPAGTAPGAAGGNRGTRPAWAPLLPELLRPLGYRSYHSGNGTSTASRWTPASTARTCSMTTTAISPPATTARTASRCRRSIPPSRTM
jgi:arylsulfatase A-like enzyme